MNILRNFIDNEFIESMVSLYLPVANPTFDSLIAFIIITVLKNGEGFRGRYGLSGLW